VSDPVVTLEPAEVSAESGGQARVVVTVRNVGSIVEGYRLELLGERPGEGPARWGEVQPAELRIYPKQQETATVVFAPPAGRTGPSGRFPFAIRVVSTVDDEVSAVVEGDVEVGRVFGLQAKIIPLTSSGRWRGRHTVEYTNWGNTPMRLRLTATDPDDKLGFLVQPSVVDVPLGGRASARVKVRGRNPFLRGSVARLPFQVKAEPELGSGAPPDTGPPRPGDPSRPVLDGALAQKPILGRGTVAVAGLLALAVAGSLAFALKSPAKPTTFESQGPPPTPQLTAAVPDPDGSVKVTWGLVDQIESYKLLTVQAGQTTANPPIPKEQNTYTVRGLNPATKYCFQLLAVRGKLDSPPSASVCATTATPQPSPSPSPSTSASAGGGGGGAAGGGAAGSSGAGSGSPSSASGPKPPVFSTTDVAVFVKSYPGPKTDATIEKQAVDFNKSVLVNGATTYVVHTTDYPRISLGNTPLQPAWLIMSGPLESNTAAEAWCNKYLGPTKACSILQPNPP
jgi:hypothetical protein